MTQVILLKNNPETLQHLIDLGMYEASHRDRDVSCHYKYLMTYLNYNYYWFRTKAAEKQYHPSNVLLADTGTLHQIELLKSLGLKDQEIWNQLKESN